MPYITQDARDAMHSGEVPTTPGELNYVITQVIMTYLDGASSYTDYNEVLGVLEAVKQEFYRRVVVPYENVKMDDNGDVFSGID